MTDRGHGSIPVVVRCDRCAELVADVILCEVRADADRPVDLVSVLRWQVETPNADFVIGLNNGVRRVTRCACDVQPCEKPEHIYTGRGPSRRVAVADVTQSVLSEIAADSVPAWCDRCCTERLVDLSELRRRLPRHPAPDGSTPTVKLSTVRSRRPTGW